MTTYITDLDLILRKTTRSFMEEAVLACAHIENLRVPFKGTESLEEFFDLLDDGSPDFRVFAQRAASVWVAQNREFDPFPTPGHALFSLGVGRLWAELVWAYNGFNVIRLSQDDLHRMSNLEIKMREEDTLYLASKAPVSPVLIEIESPIEFAKSIATITLLCCEKGFDGNGIAYGFGGRFEEGGEGWGAPFGESGLIMGPTFTFWPTLNYYLNEFPLKSSLGKTVKIPKAKVPNLKKKKRWVRPKIWLPHVPSTVKLTGKPGGGGGGGGSEPREGKERKSPVRHHRRGYWGWHAHGPGRQLRKLTWHEPTIVNDDQEIMATRRYQTKGSK